MSMTGPIPFFNDISTESVQHSTYPRGLKKERRLQCVESCALEAFYFLFLLNAAYKLLPFISSPVDLPDRVLILENFSDFSLILSFAKVQDKRV